MLAYIEHAGIYWACWDILGMLGYIGHAGIYWACWDILGMLGYIGHAGIYWACCLYFKYIIYSVMCFVGSLTGT